VLSDGTSALHELVGHGPNSGRRTRSTQDDGALAINLDRSRSPTICRARGRRQGWTAYHAVGKAARDCRPRADAPW